MRRLLLVDDSALSRNAMQAALEPYGLDCTQAENGEVAVAKAMSSTWDLIFLDVVMPVMDGPTALREIRRRGNMTPVVLITSVSTATVVASAIKLGGVHYIGKPFTPAQVRAIAVKLLKLDPAVLDSPPRVLLQHATPELPARFRKLLPPHVVIDTSKTLAESLDLAEAHVHGVVVIESRELSDAMTTVAGVLRRTQPAAGIFAMSPDASPESLWRPDGDLDGVLPTALDDALVRGFLYNHFLRPLISVEGAVARVAGFRGAPNHLPVYLAMVVRVLAYTWSRLDGTVDLQIDLTRGPADPDVAVALITSINEALRRAGAAPSFRLGPAMQAQVAPRLSQIVFV